jgi:hypothetical protein
MMAGMPQGSRILRPPIRMKDTGELIRIINPADRSREQSKEVRQRHEIYLEGSSSDPEEEETVVSNSRELERGLGVSSGSEWSPVYLGPLQSTSAAGPPKSLPPTYRSRLAPDRRHDLGASETQISRQSSSAPAVAVSCPRVPQLR